MKGKINSPYGWRWNRPHRGVDIDLRTGDTVFCCFDGVVRIAKSFGNYGNLVVVRHYNGLETVYGHLSKIKVKPMQLIKAGHSVGLGGSTGHSTGPHLHFEVRFQYEPFDPEWILDFEKYKLRTNRLYLDKTYFGIQKPNKRKTNCYYKADKSMVEYFVPEEQYHIVQKGETLKSIAQEYGTSVEKLKLLNKLSREVFYRQRIRIK